MPQAKPITNLSPETRADIRNAVALAMEYWPNAHLGDYSRQHDMRQAFRMLRSHAPVSGLHGAIGAVERSAYSHMDM